MLQEIVRASPARKVDVFLAPLRLLTVWRYQLNIQRTLDHSCLAPSIDLHEFKRRLVKDSIARSIQWGFSI